VVGRGLRQGVAMRLQHAGQERRHLVATHRLAGAGSGKSYGFGVA
jgi:hypothetical protein